MDDELESVPEEIAVVMDAEEMCEDSAWEDECLQRVPEIDDLDDREFHRCQNFLEELDAMDADTLAMELDECAYYLRDGRGWIEDEHGGAVYLERHRGDDKDE
jgi:hypothetical protein